MSLDKAIEHGKEKRKKYHGSCLWCMKNRKHKIEKQTPVVETDNVNDGNPNN